MKVNWISHFWKTHCEISVLVIHLHMKTGYCYLCPSWVVCITKTIKRNYPVSQFNTTTLLKVPYAQHSCKYIYYFHTNLTVLCQLHQAWLALHSLCCHLGHQIKGSKSGVDKVVTVTVHLDGIQPVPHSGESGIVWHTAVKQWLGYPTFESRRGGRRVEKEKEREWVKVVTQLPLWANLAPPTEHHLSISPPLHLSSSPLFSPLLTSVSKECMQRGRGWNMWVDGVG